MPIALKDGEASGRNIGLFQFSTEVNHVRLRQKNMFYFRDSRGDLLSINQEC
jgi:hypothetical protein